MQSSLYTMARKKPLKPNQVVCVPSVKTIGMKPIPPVVVNSELTVSASRVLPVSATSSSPMTELIPVRPQAHTLSGFLFHVLCQMGAARGTTPS